MPSIAVSNERLVESFSEVPIASEEVLYEDEILSTYGYSTEPEINDYELGIAPELEEEQLVQKVLESGSILGYRTTQLEPRTIPTDIMALRSRMVANEIKGARRRWPKVDITRQAELVVGHYGYPIKIGDKTLVRNFEGEVRVKEQLELMQQQLMPQREREEAIHRKNSHSRSGKRIAKVIPETSLRERPRAVYPCELAQEEVSLGTNYSQYRHPTFYADSKGVVYSSIEIGFINRAWNKIRRKFKKD